MGSIPIPSLMRADRNLWRCRWRPRRGLEDASVPRERPDRVRRPTDHAEGLTDWHGLPDASVAPHARKSGDFTFSLPCGGSAGLRAALFG